MSSFLLSYLNSTIAKNYEISYYYYLLFILDWYLYTIYFRTLVTKVVSTTYAMLTTG